VYGNALQTWQLGGSLGNWPGFMIEQFSVVAVAACFDQIVVLDKGQIVKCFDKTVFVSHVLCCQAMHIATSSIFAIPRIFLDALLMGLLP
jgi:small basic protein